MLPRPILRCVFVVAVLWWHQISAAEVKGRVFLDANANGELDPAEKGVPGVSVSDGLSVTVSDADGAFFLTSPADKMLLRVTNPPNRLVNGRFWRWCDGRRPENIPLVTARQPQSVTFIHLTDTHIGRLDMLKRFIGRVNRLPFEVEFLVHTGDLVSAVDPLPVSRAGEQFDRYLEGVSHIQAPLYELPGNHEHVATRLEDADTSNPLYGKGMYRTRVGPMHYSWTWGPYHFVALDGTRIPYVEALGDAQLEWLRQDLAQVPTTAPIVLFCHQSVATLEDGRQLQALLQGRRVVAAFCGHLHETSRRRLGAIPVYQTGAFCGAWWRGPNPDGSPQGFAVVTLSDDNVDYAYTSREGVHSLAISNPKRRHAQSGAITVESVVLDGGDPVNVSGTLGKTAFPMVQTKRQRLWSVWRGTVDSRNVKDGVRSIHVEVRCGNTVSTTALDVVVINGQAQEVTPRHDATLEFSVRGIQAYNTVWWNGASLGKIKRGIPDETLVSFEIPRERLRKLNVLNIRAVANPGTDNKDDFSVGPICLHYGGKRLRDIRYSSFARHRIGDNEPSAYPARKCLYFCLP